MDIKLEDLLNPCAACGGSGKNEQAQTNPTGGNTFGQRIVIENSRMNTCSSCNGSGFYEPTESGEVLRRFFKILRERGLA